MISTRRLLVLAVFLAFAGGCARTGVFEDVGKDPHPPEMRLLSVSAYVAPVDTTTASADPWTPIADPRERLVEFDTGGLTIRSGDAITLTLSYQDAGADIVRFRVYDLDSALRTDLGPEVPTAVVNGKKVTVGLKPKYFPGTSGVVTGPDSGLTIDSHSAGPHRFQMWAEDSHDSRSEKVEFVVNVTL